MTRISIWDDRAADTFATHVFDVEKGLEKKDPSINIKTMEELLE